MLGMRDTGMDEGVKSAANHCVSTSCPKPAPSDAPQTLSGGLRQPGFPPGACAHIPSLAPTGAPLAAGTSWREPHGHT